jgi:hypothetical protein
VFVLKVEDCGTEFCFGSSALLGKTRAFADSEVEGAKPYLLTVLSE